VPVSVFGIVLYVQLVQHMLNSSERNKRM
jgi:hypothetical protein